MIDEALRLFTLWEILRIASRPFCLSHFRKFLVSWHILTRSTCPSWHRRLSASRSSALRSPEEQRKNEIWLYSASTLLTPPRAVFSFSGLRKEGKMSAGLTTSG
jgi:hypothetical protein